MKSSQPEATKITISPVDISPGETRSLLGRVKSFFKTFRNDLYGPLPDSVSLSRFGRIKVRLRLLQLKYGWKLLTMVIVYYLIRDVTIYVIIPYLVAKKLLID